MGYITLGVIGKKVTPPCTRFFFALYKRHIKNAAIKRLLPRMLSTIKVCHI